MAQAHFSADIDNKKFKEKIKEMRDGIKSVDKTTKESSQSIEDSIKKIGTAIGVSFGIAQLVNFEKEIVNVRGEFQQLEVAFNTMLGSKERADKLMEQVVNFAATTPFDVTAVSNGTKQLLAYGSEAESVIDEMRMLGDIAAGLSIPLNDIVYLFGTTRTQGRMYTQDLRQFMGRGIPLAEELAKQFGVTKDKVGELVTEGKVGFDEMNKALQAMTSEGGKFYNLMDAQSKTIAGQISNLEDAFQQMMNNIGKNQEGIITSVLNGASFIVENYEKVAKVLLSTIAVWGTYKAAVLAAVAVNKLHNLTENIRLIAMFRKELGLATAAQQAFNTASKANIYVAAATAIVSIVTALVAFRKEIFGAKQDYASFSTELSREKSNLKEVFDALNNANTSLEDRKTAIDTLNNQYGDYFDNLLTEKSSQKDIADAYDKATVAIEANTIAKAKSALMDEQIAELDAKKEKALKSLTNVVNENTGERLSTYKQGQFEREVNALINDVDAYTTQQQFLNDYQDLLDKYEAKEKTFELTRLQNLYDYIKQFKQVLKSNEEFEQYVAGWSSDQTYGPEPKAKQEQATKKKELTDEEKKEIERKKKARQKIAQEEQQTIEESTKETSRAIQQLEYEKEAIEIAAIQDAGERKRRERELEYRQEQRQIEQQYADAIQAERRRQEQAYQELNGDLTGFQFDENTITDNAIKNYTLQMEALNIRRKQSAKEQATLEAESMREYLIQWGDYEQKKTAITEKYSLLRAEAETEGQRLAIDKEAESELLKLERAYSDTFAMIFRDASNLAKDDLVVSLQLANDKLKELQQSGKGTTEEIKDLQEQIYALQEASLKVEKIDYSATWAGVAEQIKANTRLQDLYNAQVDKTTTSAKNLDAAINKGKEDLGAMVRGAALNTLADGLSAAANIMSRISDISMDNSVKAWAEGLSVASSAFSSALQGFATGGPLGAAVGAMTSLLSIGIQKIGDFVEATQRSKSAAVEYANSMKLLNLQVEEFNSLFGSNTLKVGTDAFKKAQQAAKDYTEILKELSTKRIKLDGWANNLNSGLRQLGIYNDDGTYDFDKLKEWFEANRDLIIDESIKTQIELILSLKDAQDEALSSLDSSIAQYTGNLSSSLADAIWDGVVLGGADAWDTWQEIGADAIAEIGKQFISEMYITTYLDRYKEALRNAMGQDNSAEAMSEVMAQIINGFPTIFESASQAAKDYVDKMKALGIDVTQSAEEERTSTSKAGITATQESVDKQSGILTSIQDYVYNINDKLAKMLENSSAARTYQTQVTSLLGGIKGDTSRLAAIESNMTAMKTSLEDIVLRGVNLKN